MFLLFFGLLLINFNFVFAGEYSLTIEIEPGKIECFFQKVEEKHKNIEIDYQVIDGGDFNINFFLIFGHDKLLADNLKTNGNHQLKVEHVGDYQLCFDNSFSYQARKVVFFEIFLLDENNNIEEDDILKYAQSNLNSEKSFQEYNMTVSQLQVFFTKIKNQLNKIEYYQALFRTYEAKDRAIMNANNDRVFFWSIINSLVLIFVGALQVFMIRSLFDENSNIGKVLRR